MRFAVSSSFRLPALVLAGCLVLSTNLPSRAAEDQDAEKKPSLMHRIFGSGEDKKKEEAPPPPVETKKPGKTKSGAGEKEQSSKTKKSTAEKESDKPAKSKASSSDEDKPSSKHKSKIVMSVPGSGGTPGQIKPERDTGSPEPKTARKPSASKPRNLDSEFGKNGEDPPPRPVVKMEYKPGSGSAKSGPDSSMPAVEDSHTTLPPIDSSFEIVKYDGRDYITVDSIHRFYRFSSMRMEGNQVILSNPTLILKAGLDSQEMLMNNIKFILSYPLVMVNGKPAFSRLDLCKLIDPVLLPSHIADADPFDTVVVDAGHGGHDSGARGVYGYEKDFTLAMALSLNNALRQRGLRVVMTRSTDEFISLGGRAEIANATPRSIFVSLHFNSSGPAASGIETFALSPQGSSSTFMGEHSSDAHSYTGNHQDSANIALATAVHAMVIHRFKLVDRGIKRARWSVLTGCNRPGILFEGGFVTNGTECRLIASTTYREAVANAIADAIVNYRRALQPRMAQPSLRRVQ